MFKDHDIYVHPRKVGGRPSFFRIQTILIVKILLFNNTAEQDYIYWSSLPVAEKDLMDPLPPIFQKMTIPR